MLLPIAAGAAHITFSLIAPLSSGLIRANRVLDCLPLRWCRAGSQCELVFGIHIQNANRCPANGRLANQVEAIFLEVVFPVLAPRMEQFRHSLGLRVNAGQVRSFVQVAINTRQSQILQIVRAAMNLGDDVLEVQSCQWRIFLARQTILATPAGTLPDAGSRAGAHRLRGGTNQLSRLPLQDGDKLVCPHVASVLCPLRIGEFALR